MSELGDVHEKINDLGKQVHEKINDLGKQVERTNTILEVTLPKLATKDEVDLKISKHESADRKAIARPSRSPSPQFQWVKQFGPMILAAALGLLGIGAFLGSGDVSDVQKQIAELHQLVKKVK